MWCVIGFVILLQASDILAANCHGNECEIDQALENISAAYDEHLCKEIAKLDCHHQHDQHHELVCGTDGVTYKTHCEFAQARCYWVIYDAHHHGVQITIGIQSMGACPGHIMPTTASPVTSTVAVEMTTVTEAAVTSTDAGVTDMTSTDANPTTAPYTAKPDATTNSATLTVVSGHTSHVTTSAGSPAPTTHSVQDLMAKVFCDNRNNVDCSSDFNVQCASNGKLYPNSCEMSKAACDDPAIHVVDIVQCIGDTHNSQLG